MKLNTRRLTYGYDTTTTGALGRPTTSTDPRTGTTTTAYVTGTSQVLSITDPASVAQATYAYDSAGRTATVTNGLGKVSRYEYTARNEKLREWGDTTYPVEYGYDTWGRQTTMKTYRAGTGFTGTTWPTSTAGTADTTTWAFQESTGLLTSKTDAAGKAVAYTYTQAGQIATRAWARFVSGTTPVTTTYAYSSTTGELTSASYNDGTPTTSYTYNRLGKHATVADTTGTRTLNYALTGTLELQSEDLPSFFNTRRLTYGYDTTTTGALGRPNAFKVGTSSNPTADQSVAYTYAADGRLSTLAGGGQTFTYAYTANSHLIASVTNGNYTDTRTYDATHDWLDQRETKWSTTTKAKFAYTQDNLGRITLVTKTGEVFSRYGNTTQGLDTAYGYDDRSQLTSEQTKLGGSSTVLTGRDDSFAFDNIGNRATATHNGNTATYTANNLNQYSQRTTPGTFDVAGAAASSATVTVNSSSTGVARHGDYFFKGQSLTNTSSAVYSSLSISDGTTTTALQAFLPVTPEPFTYDLDGNLTSDGRWDYTYDAENRLVSMQTHTAFSPGIIPNAEARRIEFKQDYLGRRVEKTVRAGYNGTVYTTVLADTKFLYNGWNLAAEVDAGTGTVVRNYFWGVDLSGSMQGAGGVGGLLMVQDASNSYLPAYDAMGNVHGLIKVADGSLAAAYEYDAFGNTLRESGNYAASNPFRFSTKYTDLETGLVYYGLRYYSPSLGRFVNKDPIEERGGLNLYAFGANRGPNGYDVSGQYWVQLIRPVYAWVPTLTRFTPGNFFESLFSYTLRLVGYSVSVVWIPEPGRPNPPTGSTPGTVTPAAPQPKPAPTAPKPTTADLFTVQPGQKFLALYNGLASPFENTSATGETFGQAARALATRYAGNEQDIAQPGIRFGTDEHAAASALSKYSGLDIISIFDHSPNGQLAIGRNPIDTDGELLRQISRSLSPTGARTVELLGCSIAQISGERNGPEWLQQAAMLNNLTIRAPAFDVYLTNDGRLDLTQTPSNAVWVIARPDGSLSYDPVTGGLASPLNNSRPFFPASPTTPSSNPPPTTPQPSGRTSGPSSRGGPTQEF